MCAIELSYSELLSTMVTQEVSRMFYLCKYVSKCATSVDAERQISVHFRHAYRPHSPKSSGCGPSLCLKAIFYAQNVIFDYNGSILKADRHSIDYCVIDR